MKRNHSEVKPCWPLFRKKCEACGRMFRWERGVKWRRPEDVWLSAHETGSTIPVRKLKPRERYLCARCHPPSYVTTAGGVERWRRRVKESRPPAHHNCRCRTVEATAAMNKAIEKVGRTLGRSAKGTSVRMEEAVKNFARAGVYLEDIHITRRNKKDGAP